MAERKYPFSQVDAFTQTRLQGNPCAIVLDADDLTDYEMLAIAREMNLSETAFVMRSAKADFRFRYFTPAEEIPLAGHPTIATVHRLLEIGRISTHRPSLQIELNAGVIDVRILSTDNGHQIVMKQLPPVFLKSYPPQQVMPLFGLNDTDLLKGHTIQTVSTGTPMLMIPLKDPAVLDRIEFSPGEFARYRGSSDFFSAHLFAQEDSGTIARHFCPPPDVLEDPFTGSATGAMACYLRKYRLLKTPEFIAHQGRHLQRTGQAFIKVLETGDEITGVEVAGYAVTCLQGELTL